ncbi:MAG: DNRLRE domain-containing protein [Acidimicrobiales bacterium]|nr:DNRLRE domain-containing protein [Acidimicrobiales bacterium]
MTGDDRLGTRPGSILHVPSRASAPGGSAGFTLVELMVALTLGVLIVGVVVNAFGSMSRGTKTAEGSMRSSGSALKSSTWFADDVADALNAGTSAGIRRGQPGCGGDPASVLRFLKPGSSGVTVRSWSVVDAPAGRRLERRTCSGADLAAALAAPVTREQVVVDDLDDGTDAAVATCRATPGSDPAPSTEQGDKQCRLVSLTVQTVTGYRFTIEGSQRPVQSPSSSPVTEKRCTLLSSADTFVNSYHPDTNYGSADHVSIFKRSSGELISLIKVNLGGRCTGEDEPASLPGGRRILDAQLKIKLIRYRDPGLCQYEGLHQVRVWGQPWDENSLTWNNWSDGFQAGSNAYVFDARCDDVRKTFSIPVLQEVTQWYRGASRGGWANNGWRIDRQAAPNPQDMGEGDGFWWGSRESLDSTEWPRLVITWE